MELTHSDINRIAQESGLTTTAVIYTAKEAGYLITDDNNSVFDHPQKTSVFDQDTPKETAQAEEQIKDLTTKWQEIEASITDKFKEETNFLEQQKTQTHLNRLPPAYSRDERGNLVKTGLITTNSQAIDLMKEIQKDIYAKYNIAS